MSDFPVVFPKTGSGPAYGIEIRKVGLRLSFAHRLCFQERAFITALKDGGKNCLVIYICSFCGELHDPAITTLIACYLLGQPAKDRPAD